jgi:hypothetical protein
MLAPAPGFSRRWRSRLEAQRSRRARRQTAWSLGLALGGALAALALWALLGPLGSPGELAAQSLLRAAAWGRGLEVLFGVLGAVLGSVPVLPRALAGLYLLVTLGWLSALWLVSLYRLSYSEVRNGGNHA